MKMIEFRSSATMIIDVLLTHFQLGYVHGNYKNLDRVINVSGEIIAIFDITCRDRGNTNMLLACRWLFEKTSSSVAQFFPLNSSLA